MSSVNVCFNGNVIIDGNEIDHKWLVCRCSKANPKTQCDQHHFDTYSKSKQDAEKIVLSCSSPNLSIPSNQKIPNSSVRRGLHTIVLR